MWNTTSLRMRARASGPGFALLRVIALGLLALPLCQCDWSAPGRRGGGEQPVAQPALLPSPPEPASPPPVPRVILISLDTHGMASMSLADADHASFDTNPALARLAADPNATLFTSALGVSSWTKPTHATVFTGLYPSQHGQVDMNGRTRIPADVPTLHELASGAGAFTVHLASHLRLGVEQGYARGVDHFRLYRQPLGERGAAVLRDALKLLAQHPQGPLFMFVHLFDAHAPYDNFPRRYAEYYSGPKPDGHAYYREPRYKALRRRDRLPSTRRRNRSELGSALDPHMPASRAAHQLGIRHVDDMLGSFLDGLKVNGQYDDTTVIVFADHGEEFFEHGLLTHTSLYRQNIHVPLVIKLADGSRFLSARPDSGRVPYRVEAHTSLFRVVLDLFGLEPPGHVASAGTRALSLRRLLKLSSDSDAFAESYFGGKTHEAMLARGADALHVFHRLDETWQWAEGPPEYQLFDADHDLLDAHDLYGRNGGRVATLRAQLVSEAGRLVAARSDAPPGATLNAAEQTRLRALGYGDWSISR